ncbi:MAG: PorT family protein [Bacteroidales bacterium]|nr:PorT family protein [Bacteroidales bacterium]
MKNLKMIGLLVVAALTFSAPAQAQKFHYGVKAGANFAVQSGVAEYYDNSNILVEGHFGLTGSYNLNKKMMLESGLNYNEEGTHGSGVTQKFNYLSVPVLYDFSFGKAYNSKMTIHLNAGPSFSYLLDAKKTIDNNGAKTTTNITSGQHRAQLSGIIGVGLMEPVGKHFVTLDLRLNVAATRFQTDDSQSHNKMIGVYLGYTL